MGKLYLQLFLVYLAISQAELRSILCEAGGLLRWFEPDPEVLSTINVCDICDPKCKPKCGTRYFPRCCHRHMRKKRSLEDESRLTLTAEEIQKYLPLLDPM